MLDSSRQAHGPAVATNGATKATGAAAEAATRAALALLRSHTECLRDGPFPRDYADSASAHLPDHAVITSLCTARISLHKSPCRAKFPIH